MAEVEKETKRYPTDLPDAQWKRGASLLLKVVKKGRRLGVDLREVRNAIRFTTRSG